MATGKIDRPSKRKSDRANDRRLQRREAIVEAAARMFAEAGYDNTEMDRIAAAAKIAKGTIYLYFASKRELFFACVDKGMRTMQEVVGTVRDTAEGEPFRRVAEAMRAYFRFFDEHPHYAELLIQERAIFRDRKRPTYIESREANRGPWRDFYAPLVEEGRVRDDLPLDVMLETIGNVLYGTMFTNHFAGRSGKVDQQAAVVLEMILFGILTDDERARIRQLPKTGAAAIHPAR